MEQSRGQRRAALVATILIGLFIGLCGADAARADHAPGGKVLLRGIAVRPTATVTVSPARGPVDPIGEPPDNPIVFYPAMGSTAYRQAKAQADKLIDGGANPLAGLFLSSLAPSRGANPATGPSLQGQNFPGRDRVQAGGGDNWAPDTYGAVGNDFYVAVLNRHFDVYRKTDHSFADSSTLAQFFGYTTKDLFDPRVLKDPFTGRWFVIADTHAESPGTQLLWIAVTTGTDPSKPAQRCFYALNVAFGGDFFDYPSLGTDANSIIITGNVLHNGEPLYGAILALPKASMAACAGLTYTIFLGFPTNLAPPIVYDQNPKSFLVSPPESGSVLHLFAGQNLGTPGSATMTFQGDVAVEPYGMAAHATQCGTAEVLETLDSRFVSPSTQRGDYLWNVHTTARTLSTSNATPRWYEINTSTTTVRQSGLVFAAATSHDYNASLAESALGEMFLTWTSNNPPTCTHSQVLFSGRQATDDLGTVGPAKAVPLINGNQSGTFYDDGSSDFDPVSRWGDYSAVSLDISAYPGCDANRRAWIVNEWVPQYQFRWGSRIARIGFC
jgi:hypothetical protein